MPAHLPHTPSASDDEVTDVTAAVFERINVPSLQDPEPLVKSRLRDEAEQVTIGETENNIVFANTGGFGVLEGLEQIKRDIKILMAKDDKMTSHIEELQQNVSYLESRVGCLVQSSEGYLSIRRRFLEVYKRDVKMEKPENSKANQEGNIVAHEGDALGDAALFQRDQRTDRSTYRELYGLEYQQVLDFSTYTDGLFNKLY